MSFFAGELGEWVGEEAFGDVAGVDVGELAELLIGEVGSSEAIPFLKCGEVGVQIFVAACSASPFS